MIGEKLLDIMSNADPRLITDADKKPKSRRVPFIGLMSGLAAAAAAAILVMTIGRTPSADLPVITVGNYGVNGFGGETAKGRSVSYSQLCEIHSPWSEDAELNTMPVFRSLSAEADPEKMSQYVKAAAAKLGISEDKLEMSGNSEHIMKQIESIHKAPEGTVSPEEEKREMDRLKRSMLSSLSVSGKADGVTVSLYSNYAMRVSFDEPIKLPDGCRLGRTATDEENLAATEYLAEKFKKLLGYEKPVISKMSDEGYYGVYEGAGELSDRIVNYWTKYVIFYENFDDPTELAFMWMNTADNCEKLGDYPIIKAERAKELLKSDKYSEEERMPADAKILKTDLTYYNLSGYTAVLPYYTFYVKTDGAPAEEGSAVCDVYEICAVPERFIDVRDEDYGVRA